MLHRHLCNANSRAYHLAQPIDYMTYATTHIQITVKSLILETSNPKILKILVSSYVVFAQSIEVRC